MGIHGCGYCRCQGLRIARRDNDRMPRHHVVQFGSRSRHDNRSTPTRDYTSQLGWKNRIPNAGCLREDMHVRNAQQVSQFAFGRRRQKLHVWGRSVACLQLLTLRPIACDYKHQAIIILEMYNDLQDRIQPLLGANAAGIEHYKSAISDTKAAAISGLRQGRAESTEIKPVADHRDAARINPPRGQRCRHLVRNGYYGVKTAR